MIIPKTRNTPEFKFDVVSQTVFISGIGVPENSEEFFSNVYPVLNKFVLKSNQIIVDVYLDYFNTSFSKEFLRFLKQIHEANDLKPATKVVWRYLKDDEEMLDSGAIYEEILDTEFQFLEVKEDV